MQKDYLRRTQKAAPGVGGAAFRSAWSVLCAVLREPSGPWRHSRRSNTLIETDREDVDLMGMLTEGKYW